MTARPWMPFYFGDYLADTRHLSTLEHGAYLLLIAHYWQRGSLPDNDEQLARIAGLTPGQWRKVAENLRPLFSDGWKHKRIEFELSESARISEAGRKGGRASAESRRQAKHEQNQRDESTTVERPLNDRTNDQPTIGQPLQLQPHLQSKKEDSELRSNDVARETSTESPSGLTTKKEYEFECGPIQLLKKDFENWEKAYSCLNLRAELTALGPSEWVAGLGKKWFVPVSNLLNRRNREQKLKIEQGKDFKWRSGIEGVL